MSTRREIVSEDAEMARLAAGDPVGALRRAQANNAESGALIKFFQANADIFPCTANERLLLDWCSRKNAVASFDLLQLALGEIRRSLVATPPAAPPPPTAAELAALEKQRLLSASTADLHAELAKKNYRKREPADVLSPDCASLKAVADVRALSATEMKRLMFRPSDGSSRRANTEHINTLLRQGN